MLEEKGNSWIRKPRMRESGRKIVFNLSNIFSRLNRFIRAGFTFFTLFIRQKRLNTTADDESTTQREKSEQFQFVVCCVSYLLSLLCLMNLISELIFLLTLFFARKRDFEMRFTISSSSCRRKKNKHDKWKRQWWRWLSHRIKICSTNSLFTLSVREEGWMERWRKMMNEFRPHTTTF